LVETTLSNSEIDQVSAVTVKIFINGAYVINSVKNCIQYKQYAHCADMDIYIYIYIYTSL